jgi:hypothetical protein
MGGMMASACSPMRRHKRRRCAIGDGQCGVSFDVMM